jgi:hypothetical protein
MRPSSRSKKLAELLGGTWVYDRVSTWNCSDGRRVSRMVSDLDDEYSMSCYWLYGDGEPRVVKLDLIPLI